MLLAGVTTYVGVRPGMHVWLGMDWDVAHSTGAMLCLCAVTSVSGSRSSFGCIFRKEER